MQDVNPVGLEALDNWDKLMGTVESLSSLSDGVVLSVQAAQWFHHRLQRKEKDRLEIKATEMFPQKRDAILSALIDAYEAQRVSHISFKDMSLKEVQYILHLRASTPTQEQIALYWLLTGCEPPLKIQNVAGEWEERTGINFDMEIRRRISALGDRTPLSSKGALVNLLLALEMTPEEAALIGQHELLLHWTEERGVDLVPGYGELQSAMLTARDAERKYAWKQHRVLPRPLSSLASFMQGYRERRQPALQIHVAMYWSLTGSAPSLGMSRGRIVDEIRRLEKLRGIPVNASAAVERISDLLQLSKHLGSPLPAPSQVPLPLRLPKTVSWGTPQWEDHEAVTPWPNERTPYDPAAADNDFAPEIRSRAYKKAMQGETSVEDRFLGADGWYYLLLPELPYVDGSHRRGRIIMRRGKYYDEFPAWLSDIGVQSLWNLLKEKRSLPPELAREMSSALRGNEEALHDFWRIVGYNPVGYVVGLGGKVVPIRRDMPGRIGEHKADVVSCEMGMM